mgnify:CR=1 FL=1
MGDHQGHKTYISITAHFISEIDFEKLYIFGIYGRSAFGGEFSYCA